jgi:hypothetical protein
MGRQGPGKMDGGEAQHGGDDEQVSQREGERQRESRLTRTLTPRQNSCGGLWQQRSGEVATVMAVEVRRRRTCAARVCEARRRLWG